MKQVGVRRKREGIQMENEKGMRTPSTFSRNSRGLLVALGACIVFHFVLIYSALCIAESRYSLQE